MHKFAEKTSIAALASAKQNKYQELTNAFLADFKKLSNETIKKHAEANGLDMEKFNKDINDPALKKQVKEDMKVGSSVGVRGVPALYINGRLVKDRSLKGFSRMVEQELRKK